jgi:hypothetical protein
MAPVTSLTPEILHLIFYALQSATSGPRYALTPPLPGDDTHARLVLSDAGPLILAATCRALRDVYMSRHVASNLVLEIPASPDNEGLNHQREEPFFNFWG